MENDNLSGKRIRLYPTLFLKNLINQVFGNTRLIYNVCLDYKNQHYRAQRNQGVEINFVKQNLYLIFVS
jgi:hypothetical protein